MKCLLIEDDKITGKFIKKGLKEEGFIVDWVETGFDGLDLFENYDYDVAVVDIMLPDVNGIEIIKRARKKEIFTPVLFLSARSSVNDKVKGLKSGGDDYMTKPFAFSELVARIEVLTKRHSPVKDNVLKVGCLELDRLKYKVIRGEKEIFLQPKELSLLEYLMRNQGRVITKTMIMEHVWDFNFDPQTNVVESRVCRLRSKIDKGFKKKLIHTVRGAGYVLEEKD